MFSRMTCVSSKKYTIMLTTFFTVFIEIILHSFDKQIHIGFVDCHQVAVEDVPCDP